MICWKIDRMVGLIHVAIYKFWNTCLVNFELKGVQHARHRINRQTGEGAFDRTLQSIYEWDALLWLEYYQIRLIGIGYIVGTTNDTYRVISRFIHKMYKTPPCNANRQNCWAMWLRLIWKFMSWLLAGCLVEDHVWAHLMWCDYYLFGTFIT